MNEFGKKSLITTSLLLPITLAASSLVSWYLKTNNPDGVDITQGLAYLRPILIVSFSTFLVGWLMALIFGIIGLKKDEAPQTSKLALALLVAITILSTTAAIANSKAGHAEDAYQDQKSEQFFKDLEKLDSPD